MTTQNRVSAVLSASDRDTVLAAIETIKQAMPFLIHLSKEDRKGLPKTGDRGRGFMLNCLDAAQKHTECLPRVFDLEEMQRDIELMETLYPLLMSFKELYSMIDDTYLAVHSESYTASLKVYDAVKSHDAPGMRVVVDQLKQQFARRNKKDAEESNSESATLPENS